ncbi:MAG: antibiotic biosynthesis monooxygenase [Clostridia bacterium]|nr:antibiotic biosynthesis monooxygenase [Clostridia bacterium]
MFEILVIYTAKNGVCGKDFIKDLEQNGVLSAIRNENGCVKYEYYLPYEGASTILLYEIWESPEHQRVHMTQPHMKLAMEIKQKYIDSVQLKKLSEL